MVRILIVATFWGTALTEGHHKSQEIHELTKQNLWKTTFKKSDVI